MILSLNLTSNKLGENCENLKKLGEGMNYFPNNLKILIIDLKSNNLGSNTENLKYLADGIKKLPNKNL